MADPVEAPPSIAEETSRMQDEASAAIRDAKAKGTERELARQLIEELERMKTAAREVVAENQKKGSIQDKKQEAKEVKRSVIRVLAAVKEGIIDPPPQAKTILVELANQGITDSSASYLQRIVDKYVNNDIVFSQAGQDKSDFEKDFEILKSENPSAAQGLVDSLKKAVQKGQLNDLTEAKIDEKFQVPATPSVPPSEATTNTSAKEIGQEVAEALRKTRLEGQPKTEEEATFKNDWDRLFNQFYNPYEKEILESLYSLDKFKELIKVREKQVEDDHAKEHPDRSKLSQDEIMREVSERIETDIVLLYSKLFTRVDQEKPTEFFQEIIQKGFMDSISTASETFNKRIGLLASTLDHTQDNELVAYRFSRRHSEERTDTKEVKYEETSIGPDGRKQTEEVKKLIPQYRVFPFAAHKGNLTLREFLESVRLEMGHEFETRAYLHNVRAMFLKGPGKDGFWPQLAHYAEEMKSTDIDGVMNLPDSDIFMTAYRLYQKYVEEAFAKNDWIHSRNMFSSDLGAINTKIEENVMNSLKELYGDKLGNLNTENADGKTWFKNEWRLRRAMTMAVGIARGLLLTEPETASWADPSIKPEDGTSTFLSYYTNDSTALNGLNPQHTLLRFLTESTTQGPLIFMLASGFDAKTLQGWDHKELWNKMQNFKDSFMKGKRALHRDNPQERTIMELLPNISNVGSLVTRDSWRTFYAYEGWVQYLGAKDGNAVTKDIDFLNTWKSIENIGYEAVLELVNNRLSDDFLLGTKAQKGEREKLLRYVYGKYIDPSVGANTDAADAGINDLLTKYKPDVVAEVEKLIKKGKILREKRDEYVTKELYKRVFYRGLVGLMAQRMPTKFIRIDRSRHSEKGVRSWEILRNSLGMSHDTFDAAMRDLLLVESQLRLETSKKMRAHLGTKHNLYDLEIDDYKMSEAKMRQFIKGPGADVRIQAMLRVYGEMSSQYLNNESFLYEFSRKIRAKDASGMFINVDFPFALGTEELDMTFMAYRNIGERALARAVGDIGAAETDVFGELQKILQSLHPIAVGEKHDFMPFVESLAKIQQTIGNRIDKGYSHKVVGQLAGMIIAYYKKDTRARNLWTKLFSYNRKNSLAAEFAGSWSNVWEWDVGDIDKFMFELGRRRILPNEPYDLNNGPGESLVPVTIPFTNIKLFDRKVKRAPDYEYYTGKVRKDFGASKINKVWEMVNTALPLFLIFLLWRFMKDAFGELEGGKK